MTLSKVAAPEFDLAMTLDSGQVFHWEPHASGFVGTIGDRPLYMEQRAQSLFVTRGSAPLVGRYFALDHPLGEICAAFPDDAAMRTARDYCSGLRIIRQPVWECLATFITSSMKQVAHIRQMSRALRDEAGKFAEARAEAYDVVLNGVEIGGGSIRIHEPDLQAKMFAALGVSEEDQQTMFGHILRAFRLGAPPHGGIAMGLDRLVMLICGAESIREVMAFPKNNRGLDLMSQSPSDVDPRQLRDLRLALKTDKPQ